MEDGNKELLNGQIQRDLESLEQLDLNSKERSDVIDNLVKLYKLRIEETKVDWECSEKYESRIMEQDRLEKEFRNHEEEIKNQKELEKKASRMQYLKVGLELSAIIIPAAFYWAAFNSGLRFEKDGIVGSSFMRSLIGKFKPIK